ncbi:MAG: hypothetical protein Tsb0013_11620 [Phycisphaerales bacterium]
MWFRRQARPTRRTGHDPNAQAYPRAGRPVFEPLEKKEMLSGDAPRVVDILADNRGLVQIVVDQDLSNLTVNQQSVRFFTAGDDGLLGTADDVTVNNVSVNYTFGTRTITADARLLADTAYGVRLDGSIIRGVNGCFLDGEFNGSGTPSGDGVEGGDTLFYARAIGPTIARLTTNLGVIDIELFADETPLHVANFLRYANERLYDGVIFHRSVDDFVIQGGGFESDLPFLPIPTFDPVQNEPGISNLRGTIALAKQGGNPNSGTSQFFFNLGDNSSNLDNQNGGFTVFGEALNEESLAVIDAIAALETFNASVTNGAFTDVPVLDLELIEGTSGVLMERDVVRIDRVARLLAVDANPFDQIDTDEVRVITQNGSAARVTLYALNGDPLGDLDDFVRVNFGAGDRVESITFTAPPPAPVGLQITGASSVGSISERRAGQLSFIVSTVRVDEIRLKSAISGFALNGVLLADNVLLPEDLDGDNVFDDNTSIYVMDGMSRSVRLDSGLSGDVLIPGGLMDLRVKGETTFADIRLGDLPEGATVNARFDRVRDSVFDADAPVRQLRADGWSPFLTQRASVEAPTIQTLRINGNFGADLTITEPSEEALVNARIAGDILRSDWDIRGSITRLRFDAASGWNGAVQGDTFIFRAGPLINTTFSSQGETRSFRVDEIDGGLITLGSASRFIVARGDLQGDVTISNRNDLQTRTFRVKGDFTDGGVSFATEVNNFRVQGNLSDVVVNGVGFGNLRFKEVTDTEFTVQQDVRQIRVTSWDGGSFQASSARGITTTGNARDDNPGDFNADITVSDARVVRIAGGINDADVRLGDNRVFRVGGDIVDTDVRFFRLFFFATISAVDIDVQGSLIGSRIMADADVNSVRVDAMLDSGIYIGSVANPQGFAGPGVINSGARVGSVLVRGEGPLEHRFENSYIVGGRIDYVRIADPLYQNQSPFGIAGGRIDRVEVISDELTRGYTSPDQGTVVLDDLQIRPAYQAPA